MFAEPQNEQARRLLADAYEQLGYRAESTSVRNSFLQGAFELRNGLPGGVPPRSTGPDVVRAMVHLDVRSDVQPVPDYNFANRAA